MSSRLWNELIQRYHYLGHRPLPGAQLRYFVNVNAQPVALLGFGAAAWKTAPRDQFIGWNAQQRTAGLHLIVGNARFLILPWVQCKGLASKILGRIARQLPNDWAQCYGYRPVLLETFVQADRFRGTCYKAANWLHVGKLRGAASSMSLIRTPCRSKTSGCIRCIAASASSSSHCKAQPVPNPYAPA